MVWPLDIRNLSCRYPSLVMVVVVILVLNALDCRFGRCYNEVHDAIGDSASLVTGNVVCEPVICE